MSKPIDLASHARYKPDLVGLACGKVSAARLRLGLSHAEFAAELGRLLTWHPTPGLIRSWDRATAPPPGDVLAACDVLAPRQILSTPGTSSSNDESDNVPRQPSSPGLVSFAPAEFGDSGYLQSVQEHTREIVTLDNQFGGADLVRISARSFRTLRDQLDTGAYDPRIGRELFAAAGELAEVVGWVAYDAEEHALARRMNQESLYFTRLCGDKSTELLTLQNASMHAAAQMHPDEALQIARSVLEGDYKLSARLRGLFLTRKARAMAQCGDEAALGLFPEIRDLFLDGVDDADPAWAWWLDERELMWHEAMALRDLGLAEPAAAQFEQSVLSVPANETRSQYVHRSHLLQAQVENKSWTAAAETVQELIPLSAQVASTRAVVVLRRVLAQVGAAQDRDRVPEGLQEQAEHLRAALSETAV